MLAARIVPAAGVARVARVARSAGMGVVGIVHGVSHDVDKAGDCLDGLEAGICVVGQRAPERRGIVGTVVTFMGCAVEEADDVMQNRHFDSSFCGASFIAGDRI